MAVDPELRTLQIDIPARPESLVKLSLLMADEDMNLAAAARLWSDRTPREALRTLAGRLPQPGAGDV